MRLSSPVPHLCDDSHNNRPSSADLSDVHIADKYKEALISQWTHLSVNIEYTNLLSENELFLLSAEDFEYDMQRVA
jgi:hypothetical protein